MKIAQNPHFKTPAVQAGQEVTPRAEAEGNVSSTSEEAPFFLQHGSLLNSQHLGL